MESRGIPLFKLSAMWILFFVLLLLLAFKKIYLFLV